MKTIVYPQTASYSVELPGGGVGVISPLQIWKIQGSGGGGPKGNSLSGGVWIFSGTTHFSI